MMTNDEKIPNLDQRLADLNPVISADNSPTLKYNSGLVSSHYIHNNSTVLMEPHKIPLYSVLKCDTTSVG